RQQKAEHREARDRLYDVGNANDRRREPRPPPREDAERHSDRDSHERRQGDEQNMLAEQRQGFGAVRQPEVKNSQYLLLRAFGAPPPNALWPRASRSGYRASRVRARVIRPRALAL